MERTSNLLLDIHKTNIYCELITFQITLFLGNNDEWDLVLELTVKLGRWPEVQSCHQLRCYLHMSLVCSVNALCPPPRISVGFLHYYLFKTPCPYGLMDFLECGEVWWDEYQVISAGMGVLGSWGWGEEKEGRGEGHPLWCRRGIRWYGPWVQDMGGSPWRWKLSCPWAMIQFQHDFHWFSGLRDPSSFRLFLPQLLPFHLVLLSPALPSAIQILLYSLLP